ncbi:unnamed protein product [Angiostrongylus costaricensis]|uniref:Transcription initiation factor TFIID subunit 6 n=1 Tax=Angiostrongylus costaricensis TaxID=334426 RepID=A0A158PLI0_ANGCS|nr:unnamed protein product [Angiostrongylus costaricensis]
MVVSSLKVQPCLIQSEIHVGYFVATSTEAVMTSEDSKSQNYSSFTEPFSPCIQTEYVRTVGDSLGLVNLTPAALQCLADSLTELLTRCSKAARKLAIHGRRRTVLAGDVQNALRMMCIPVPTAFMVPPQPSMLQLRMPAGEQLYIKDNVDLNMPLRAQPSQTRNPSERHIRIQWLRVENDEYPQPLKKMRMALPGNDFTSSRLPAALRKRTLLHPEIVSPSLSYRLAAQGLPRKERILLNPLPPDPLSVEEQRYLKEVVEACVGVDREKRRRALQSLERNATLHVFLPRLSRLFHTSVRCNIVLRSLSMLIYIVRMMKAVAFNASVKLDGVLHEFLPSLISCMVCRILCDRPELEDHWVLRDVAGSTLIKILKDHGTENIRRRSFLFVKKVFFDSSSSYPMIYGTIATLLELAPPDELVRLRLRFMTLLERTRSASITSADQQERIEARKLYRALSVRNVFTCIDHSQECNFRLELLFRTQFYGHRLGDRRHVDPGSFFSQSTFVAHL